MITNPKEAKARYNSLPYGYRNEYISNRKAEVNNALHVYNLQKEGNKMYLEKIKSQYVKKKKRGSFIDYLIALVIFSMLGFLFGISFISIIVTNIN